MRALPILTLLAALATPAAAATFDVESDAGLSLGSFEAPDAGGPLGAAALTFGGVVFDLFASALNPPVYEADTGQLSGELLPVARFVNGAEGLIDDFLCPAGECLLSFLPGEGSGTFAVEYFGDDPDDERLFGSGSYVVSLAEDPVAPVPLPAAAPLLAGALALLGLAARRRPT